MRDASAVVYSFLFLPPLDKAAAGPALSAAAGQHTAQWAYGLAWLRLLAQGGWLHPAKVVMGSAGFQALPEADQAFLQTLPLQLFPEKHITAGGGPSGWARFRAAWQKHRHQRAFQKMLQQTPSAVVAWDEVSHRFLRRQTPVFSPSPAQHLPPVPWPDIPPPPQDPALLQAVNDQICAGAAYFLVRDAALDLDGCLVLLKAFSLFKKWTKSNMKMVFAEKTVWATKGLREKLETYKYRSDLVFWDGRGWRVAGDPTQALQLSGPGGEESLAPTQGPKPLATHLASSLTNALTAAAYALLLPAPDNSCAWGFVAGVNAKVPVLVPGEFDLDPSWTGKTYTANFQDPDSLGAQLQLLYRNEKLRGERLEAAAAEWNALDPAAAARAFWEAAQAG